MQAEAREIVALLLAAGADPSIRNKNGKTPGDYATDETIRALLVVQGVRREWRQDNPQIFIAKRFTTRKS